MGVSKTSRGAPLSTRETVIFAAIGVATVVAGVLNYTGAPGVPTFVVATLALAGLAWVVSFAT